MTGQSIRIPIELELKNIQGVIQSLKSSLNGVSKDTQLYKNLSKELTQIENKFKELNATASRPFSNTSSIHSFENQILKLGDRITEVGKEMSGITFKDLDLSAIPGAEEEFNKLTKEVNEAQQKLDSVKTTQLGNALNDATGKFTNLQNIIEDISKNPKLSNLIDTSNFEKTFSNLENSYSSLSQKIDEAKAKIEGFNKSIAGRETNINTIRGIKDYLNNNTFDKASFDNMIQQQAQNINRDPKDLLALFGLNDESLYQGAANEVTKRLLGKLNTAETREVKAKSRTQQDFDNVNTQIQEYEQLRNKVEQARTELDNLQNSNATQGAIDAQKQKVEETTSAFDAFIRKIMETNGVSKSGANSIETIIKALNGITQKTPAATTSLDQLNNAANKLSQMKSRLAYFFSFYKVMGTIRNVVKEATTTIKELDQVMTEIAVVTNMTQEDLWNQVDTYSAIANEYAVSIKGVYEVSQLYYQQGLQTAEVMDLTVETLKMAKIANLDYATATDYMTVAIRGFKMEMSEAQTVTDVYSALAATTASDTEELAIAMSKTASSAEAVGATFESTSAMIATMVSITREAPEIFSGAYKKMV